ncbi:hypothetical protein V2J09_003809 [Rumex salicifolius]
MRSQIKPLAAADVLSSLPVYLSPQTELHSEDFKLFAVDRLREEYYDGIRSGRKPDEMRILKKVLSMEAMLFHYQFKRESFEAPRALY